MLSEMGCEKFQMTPGKLLEFLVHRGDQCFLVLMEDGTPLLLRLQIDEVLGVEEAGSVGAVVGPAGLADHLRHFRKRRHDDARLVGEVDAGGGPFAGRQSSANPDRAFVEVRQKLRPDGPAKSKIDRDDERGPPRCRRSQLRCSMAVRTAMR